MIKQNNITKKLLIPIIWSVFILSIAFVSLVLFIQFTGVYIGPGASDFILPLGNSNYELSRTSKTMACINKYVKDELKEVVAPTVQEMAYDNSFIMVKQYPLESTDNEDDIQYWIIDINKKSEYGPLSEDEFNSKKLEFKINTTLKLKNVDSYRNDKN
ncbi:DUF3997 domain-containing protein [Clostridium sp. MSJ-11]|uniref:DUF3997 domain-containing protein n=1 Tax=Clostridium mobile TaxID=2841512 RepID=A0ABS6EH88_9CLOT|nr:DUF3997 domain-containing protein [Clostridium mobile]MBU5484581.1 DUF3997 domain-containing protein [Clostridium mobile]